ncbi:MAG: hypothetical protein JXA11_01260 [Phycisphaerae bacterium]|nr:hypothetical protein [Phycisphaerae bacterium]
MSSIQGRRPEDNVVKISILKESSVYLDTTRRAELELGKRYLFVVEFKIDDMHYTGNWYNRPAGVRMYVYGMKDKHSTLFVRGDGSTDGWVSAVMPFTTRIDKDGRDLSRPNVLLRCYNMVGTVSFRKPIIIEVPNGVEASSYFEMDNGRMVHGGVLTLTETQEGDKS